MNILNDSFYLTFTSKNANFGKFHTGQIFLPEEIILDTLFEVTLDTFYSNNTFDKEKFITINCDLILENLVGTQYQKTLDILYHKNINNQILKNNYHVVPKYQINSINISIQDLNYKDINFDENKDFWVIRLHFRKLQ